MKLASLVATVLLLVPLVGADPLHLEDLEHEVDHAVEEAQDVVDSWVNYVETHADCDVEDLGHLQTDGVYPNGEHHPCDAPDSVEEFDRNRQVAVNDQTRGSLFFGHEGIDDQDVFVMTTDETNSNYRYNFYFGLGIDMLPDVEFGAIDFDIITLEGDSLLDYDSPAYDDPNPNPKPEPRAGYEFEVKMVHGYEESIEQYKVHIHTYDETPAPPVAYGLLSNGRWISMQLDGTNVDSPQSHSNFKYVYPADEESCSITHVLFEEPEGASNVRQAQVDHAPTLQCEEEEPTPEPQRRDMSAQFTLPPWIAGQDILLVVWVSEYSDEAAGRQVDEYGSNPVGTVEDLLGPRHVFCDRDGCSLFLEERKDLPAEYGVIIFEQPPELSES